MEIVIKIDDELYNEILSRKYSKTRIEKAVANGTPLPEHHGRLIDAGELKKNNEEYIIQYPTDREEDMQNKMVEWINEDIENAPTIIEADKGVLEKINEKQDSLRATCKAWDEAISRDGYVD